MNDSATHLGRDELKTRELPPCLLVDDVLDLGVDLGERSIEHLVLHGQCEQRRNRAEGRGGRTKSGVEAIVLYTGVVRRDERMGRERRRSIEKNLGRWCYKASQNPPLE